MNALLASGLWHDLRYAARLLRRERGHALVAILTMALGIGATTTLFSVAYGVLLKPLPWADSDRLVRVSETRQGRSGRVRGTILNSTYLAWADGPATIDAIGGWLGGTSMTLSGSGEADRLQVTPVTPSLFPMLGARPIAGRLFTPDEGVRGKPGVILLSYGLWQSRFGGRSDIVGQPIRLDDQQFTIVGIMSPAFAFPTRETRAWTAWRVQPLLGEGGAISGTIFSAMARLRPGVSAAQAAAEGTARGRGAPNAGMVATALFGSSGPVDVSVTLARDALTSDVKPAIVVMLVAVLLLLATATANVASLELARATTRRREIAIRAAIGAAAGRLTRQLLAESALLGLAGGAAGLGLAIACHRVLPAVLPADFPRLDDVAVDGRVMSCAIALSMAASIVCGLLPALHAQRVNLVETLADGGSAPSGGGLRDARQHTQPLHQRLDQRQSLLHRIALRKWNLRGQQIDRIVAA
ncbi:MAG: ABC transporter permease, partial [Acidobacteria bacterium]|nr:ABC transporter permease [Acidobacteriota bacterium]